jgi:hypothetical protein
MDVPTCDSAKELANELGDSVTFYKIGLELMMSGEYFDLLDWMLARLRSQVFRHPCNGRFGSTFPARPRRDIRYRAWQSFHHGSGCREQGR